MDYTHGDYRESTFCPLLVPLAVAQVSYIGRRQFESRCAVCHGADGGGAEALAHAEADLAALELPPGATLVTISSAGCNALSYLVANPKQVYAAFRAAPSKGQFVDAYVKDRYDFRRHARSATQGECSNTVPKCARNSSCSRAFSCASSTR